MNTITEPTINELAEAIAEVSENVPLTVVLLSQLMAKASTKCRRALVDRDFETFKRELDKVRL